MTDNTTATDGPETGWTSQGCGLWHRDNGLYTAAVQHLTLYVPERWVWTVYRWPLDGDTWRPATPPGGSRSKATAFYDARRALDRCARSDRDTPTVDVAEVMVMLAEWGQRRGCSREMIAERLGVGVEQVELMERGQAHVSLLQDYARAVGARFHVDVTLTYRLTEFPPPEGGS